MKPGPCVDSLPRVLFVTPCAFNRRTGGGVTFSNLFAGWPKDRLATVTSDRHPVSRDVCERFRFLDDSEIGPIPPLDLLRRSTRGKVISAEAWTATMSSPSIPRRLGRHLIGPAGLPDRGRLSGSLEDWIAEFRPEVLYTILGSIGYLELVEQISDTFSLSPVIHLMDEGVTEPRQHGLFGRYIRRRYTGGFRSLIARTSARIAICDEMAAVYESRFGMPFDSIQNAIDVERFARPASRSLDVGQTARLVYVGSVLPHAQLRSLARVADTVARLRTAGRQVTLDIFTPRELLGPAIEGFEALEGVAVHETLTDDREFFETLISADGLILPVNFDRPSIHFIGLSMPTKVPAYLTSGTPVLVFGPAGVAQIEYARTAGWGLVVDRPDSGLLERGIERLLDDAPLRRSLSAAALAGARQRHDIAVVRTRFRTILTRAAGYRSSTRER